MNRACSPPFRVRLQVLTPITTFRGPAANELHENLWIVTEIAGKIRLKLEGHIDTADARCVNGWVIDMDNPQSRLVLEIHCGDGKLGTFTADRYRKDLAEKGFGDGQCGFHFNMPPGTTASRAKAARIFIQDTRHMFVAGQTRPRPFRISEEAYATLAKQAEPVGGKRFTKCILHIGIEKTGTTSLQSFLSLNRNEITRKGFFVPKTLAHDSTNCGSNHVRLTAVALDDTRFDEDLRGVEGVTDSASLQAFRAAVYQDFDDEISAAPASCDTLLLSNEHCHSRLQSVEEVGFLKLWLDRYCESYEIIVYLRPQHEIAASQYGMMLLLGLPNIDLLPSFNAPVESKKVSYTNWSYFDYDELLTRWAMVFGHAALVPRIYTQDDLRNNCIVEDFCWARLPLDRLVLPERENTNVSATAQKFLIPLNNVLARDDHAVDQQIGAKIRDVIRNLFPGKGMLPARDDAETFLDQFRRSNENVRAEWFPAREKLFDVDFSKYPRTSDDALLTPEHAISIFLEILRQL